MCCKRTAKIAASGRKILVATKKQAKDVVLNPTK